MLGKFVDSDLGVIFLILTAPIGIPLFVVVCLFKCIFSLADPAKPITYDDGTEIF
jgi:hypothetical protein